MSDRHCFTCKQTKPETEFYPSLKTRCRSCAKAKALETHAEKLTYATEWRKANPNAAREWYVRNRERKSAYNAQWYAANRETEKVRYAAWVQANPGKAVALLAKRRASLLRATVLWGSKRAIDEKYELAARLTKETGIPHEVDHIVPLQGRNVCGLHWEGNLQVLTKTENLKKANRTPEVPR